MIKFLQVSSLLLCCAHKSSPRIENRLLTGNFSEDAILDFWSILLPHCGRQLEPKASLSETMVLGMAALFFRKRRCQAFVVCRHCSRLLSPKEPGSSLVAPTLLLPGGQKTLCDQGLSSVLRSKEKVKPKRPWVTQIGEVARTARGRSRFQKLTTTMWNVLDRRPKSEFIQNWTALCSTKIVDHFQPKNLKLSKTLRAASFWFTCS